MGGGTTEPQLSLWASQNIPMYNNFLGVFARDQLPKRVRGPACFIVNYGRSCGDIVHGHLNYGEHWVAIVVDAAGAAEWCDSMGQRPDGDDYAFNFTTHFESYLSSTFTKYTYNPIRLQAYGSGVCGQYSLYACLVGGSPASKPKSYTWASAHYRLNDSTIKQLVRI